MVAFFDILDEEALVHFLHTLRGVIVSTNLLPYARGDSADFFKDYLSRPTNVLFVLSKREGVKVFF